MKKKIEYNKPLEGVFLPSIPASIKSDNQYLYYFIKKEALDG
jgi:hypothetical protein